MFPEFSEVYQKILQFQVCPEFTTAFLQKVSTAPKQASLEVQDRLVRFQHFRLQGAVKLGDLHGHHGAGVVELFGEENLRFGYQSTLW